MSNAYVNQIFSEQPLAVWALDDDISYLSLISDSQRVMTGGRWSFTNLATATLSDETVDPYYALDKTVNRIVKTGVSSSGNFVATSALGTFTAANDYFNIGFYYLKDSPYVSSIDIGYKVGGTTTYATSIPTSVFYEWTFISATFPAFVGSANIVLRFNYAAPAVTDDVSIRINGLTVGERSEVSNRVSLGATKVGLDSALDSVTGLSCDGVRMYKHGSDESHGYYIIDGNNSLCARSSASSMVYGSTTSVTITPALGGNPSMVVNGYGFFSKAEKYRSRTLEMWLRIKTSATSLTRIIGPVVSDDGLYVDGPFLVLKAGKYSGSYYVGEWQRPMLVQISISPTSLNLFINGGNAISISLDSVPEFVGQYEIYDSKEPEWIGFYASPGVPQIDIDAIAIYPYETNEEKSLRRFGYGQAVKFPQDIIAAHDGETLYTDYSLSNYGKSKSYGNNLKDVWENGYLDNFVSESNVLKTINFGLPEIEIAPGSAPTLTENKFFLDLSTAIGSSDPFIDMQPTSDWSGVNSHLFFSILGYNSTTSGTPKSIYVMATRSEANTSKQTLFRLVGGSGHIEAYVITETSPTTANKIVYEFVYNGVTQEIGSVSGNVIGTKFIAGIDIQDLTDNGLDGMREFLSSSSLSLYVGGFGNFSSTFTGKIYKVSISNDRNRLGIKDFFTDGLFSGVLSDLDTHYASYSLNAKKVFGIASLDVSSNSYWRDAVPASYFAKRVQTSEFAGETRVDMLQVNIDAPEPISFSGGNYDTSDSNVKAYVTFKIGDISEFVIQPLDQGKLVVPDTDWATTAYEVVDGTIVKMPDVEDSLRTSITYHIVANTENANLYRTTIRSFQISALTNETYDTAKAALGTRYGVDLQSFQDSEDTQNLFIMPRYTDEYYYLSNNSGIKLVGDIDGTYGYKMSLNNQLADTFNIGAFQVSMKIALQEFSTTPVLLFYVTIDGHEYRFYIDSYNSGNTRAKIYATYDDGEEESAYNLLEYYVNNVVMDFPVVNADEWFTLNINFKENISLDGTEGFINFCGPMIINNFSYVQLSDEQKSQQVLVENRWIDTKYSATSTLTWTTWSTETWNDVAGARSASTGVSGFDSQELYRSITKTGVIGAGYEPNQKLLAKSFKYFVYSGVIFDKKTTPVT